MLILNAAAKTGGEGDGEVDNVVSNENSDENRGSVGEVRRCSGGRCPDVLGGMCLREGAAGCNLGEKCCGGLKCHIHTGMCMGEGGMKYS